MIGSRASGYRRGDHMLGKVDCLVGIHHWSDWEVQDPQRPSEQVRSCARCLHAQRSGDRAGGKVACLFGVHRWSQWKPVDSEGPGRQFRTSARCSRVKFNNGPANFRWDIGNINPLSIDCACRPGRCWRRGLRQVRCSRCRSVRPQVMVDAGPRKLMALSAPVSFDVTDWRGGGAADHAGFGVVELDDLCRPCCT